MAKPGAGIDWLPWLGARAAELQSSISFLTRLPFPRGKPADGASSALAAWAFENEQVGAAIGCACLH